MDKLKWIELAAGDEWRPAMSYAYQTELLGEPVTLACDVFRMHWVYEQKWEAIIPLKHSATDGLSAAQSWAEQMPTRMSGLLDGQIGARFTVSAQGLKQAFKCAKAINDGDNAVRMIYDPCGRLRIFSNGANGDSLSMLPTRPLGVERGKPLSACCNAVFMLEALRLFTDGKKDQQVEVQFSAWVNRDSRSLTIGQAGKAYALIMQMDAKRAGEKAHPFIKEWTETPRI